MTAAVTSEERTAALEAVRAASEMCRSTQRRLVDGDTLIKGDESPVTVADFAAQALVAATLADALGEIDMVGEEDATDLHDDARATLRDGVVDLVRRQRGVDTTVDMVLDWIALGGSTASAGRFWTLDPIDGTKGFLRGDQYAIALALIDQGQVVLGVLGCPNLPNADGSVGAIFVATDGACHAYYGDGVDPVRPTVAVPASLPQARFCESVESGHSNHDHSAQVCELLGIEVAPYRIDSQCKYAAVARGDASVYMRLPTRADYREKIWDHAAGKFVVEQAGGRVTDIDGVALDFSRGARLEGNRGIIATDGRFHDDIVAAVQRVLAGT